MDNTMVDLLTPDDFRKMVDTFRQEAITLNIYRITSYSIAKKKAFVL